MTRRLFALIVAYAWLAGCGGRASGPANPIPQLPAAAQPPSRDMNVNELPEPPVVHAVNGVAKFSLIANVDPATGLPSFQYNYQHGVAPTIDINPGESFEIELTDDLPREHRNGLVCESALSRLDGFAERAIATTCLGCSQNPVRGSTTSCTFQRIKGRGSTGITCTSTARRAIKSARAECPARSSSRA